MLKRSTPGDSRWIALACVVFWLGTSPRHHAMCFFLLASDTKKTHQTWGTNQKKRTEPAMGFNKIDPMGHPNSTSAFLVFSLVSKPLELCLLTCPSQGVHDRDLPTYGRHQAGCKQSYSCFWLHSSLKPGTTSPECRRHLETPSSGAKSWNFWEAL